MAGSVQVHGLKELRRGLNKYGGKSNATVKVAHRKVGELVKSKTPRTAKKAPPSRGPRSSNRAAANLAGSFRSSPTVSAARIVSTLPYAFGAEFGSKQFRQFPSWVGQNPGRVGWAAVEENETEIRDEYGDALMEAFRGAFPEPI